MSYDPFWDDVTLLLGQDQPNASTTFTDESPAGNSPTPAGNVQYSTADPKFGTSAIEFDGTSDYLVTDLADLLGITTSVNTAFTFDAWINVDNVSTSRGIAGSRFISGDNEGFTFVVGTSRQLVIFGYSSAGAVVINEASASNVIDLNTWHFVRLTRDSGGTWRIGVDGTEVASGTETALVNQSNSTALWIGSTYGYNSGSNAWFDGQMEQVRVTSGVARPITELPTAPFPTEGADPYWNDVELYLDFEGQVTTDLSAAARNPSGTLGTPAYSTGYNDNDSLDTSIGAVTWTPAEFPDLAAETVYTLDMWIRQTAASLSGSWLFSSVYASAASRIPLHIGFTSGGASSTGSNLSFGHYDGTFRGTTSTWTTTQNQWHFIRCIRNGDDFELYSDGVLRTSFNVGANPPQAATGNVILGRRWDGNGQAYWKGDMDHVRLTVGVARDGTEVPVAPFPTQAPFVADPYWNYVTLLVKSDDTDGSTTFVDSSPVGNTPTVTGTTQHDTDQSKWGASAIYFPGAGDEISFPKDAVTGITDGSGNDHTEPLTIECWIRCASLAATQYVFGTRFDTGSVNGMALRIGTDGATQFYGYKSSPTATVAIESAASTIAINTWHFLQITYDGTTWEYLVDGVSIGTSTGLIRSHPTNNEFILGTVPLVTVDFDGWIDDFRYTKGVVRSNDVPIATFPTQPTTDPFWGDVKLLALFLTDANDSTTLANDFTLNGNAAISSQRLELDGTGDYATQADDADLNLWRNQDYCLELFLELDTFDATADHVIGNYDAATDNWSIDVLPTGAIQFFYWSGAVNTYTSATGVISTGTRHHIVFQHRVDTNAVELFVDGVSVATGTASNIPSPTASTPFEVGGRYLSRWTDGRIDNLRVTHALRYTSSYSVPVTPFPTQGPAGGTDIAAFTEQLQIQTLSATITAPNGTVNANVEQLQIQTLSATIEGEPYDFGPEQIQLQTLPATIALQLAPQLTGPVNVSVTEGDEAVFTVAAESGLLPLTYQWYKDGVALTGETSEQLFYDALFEDNGSTFYVIVTDSLGQTTQSATATLTVAEQTSNRMALVWNYEDDNYTWMDAAIEQGVPAAQLPIECQPPSCAALEDSLVAAGFTVYPLTDAAYSVDYPANGELRQTGSPGSVLLIPAGFEGQVNGFFGSSANPLTGVLVSNSDATLTFCDGATNLLYGLEFDEPNIGAWVTRTSTPGVAPNGIYGAVMLNNGPIVRTMWAINFFWDVEGARGAGPTLINTSINVQMSLTTLRVNRYGGFSDYDISSLGLVEGEPVLVYGSITAELGPSFDSGGDTDIWAHPVDQTWDLTVVNKSGTVLNFPDSISSFQDGVDPTSVGVPSANVPPNPNSNGFVIGHDDQHLIYAFAGSTSLQVSALAGAFQRNFTDYQRPSYCALLDQEIVGTVAMDYGFDPGWQVRWSDLSATSWNDLSSTSTRWSDFYRQGQEQNLYYLTPSGLWKADQVVKTDGLKQYYVEREGIDLDDLVTDWTTNKWKHIRQFYFHLESDLPAGTTAPNNFDMTVGWAKNLMDTPDWENPVTVNLQSTTNSGEYKVDFRTTGRYLSLRFDFDDTGELVMTGGDIDAVESHGR